MNRTTPTEPRFHGTVTEKSHKTMSRIRGKDTKIEVTLRKALWQRGYRYRKNYKDLPGRPDIVLTKYKIAIFCDSEFFHGKDWEILKPKLEKGKNPDYWVKKIQRNIERDEEKDKISAQDNHYTESVEVQRNIRNQLVHIFDISVTEIFIVCL